jgi:BlaI family transcriptional regulator, penicillinase repressor
MSKIPRPTDAELAILRVLWERGPSTVRQVHEVLSRRGETGYTTVLKLMQIMTDKGLVVRDESQRAHVYAAAVSEEVTQRHLVTDLLTRAFACNTSQLVLQALSSKKTTPDELAEIRRMLDELDEDSQ